MYRVADQRPASGGTAVVAAILALLGGIVGVVGVVFGVVATVNSERGVSAWGLVPGWMSAVSVVTLVVDLLAGVLLVAGAILVFRRRGAGPTLVVLGCVGVLVAYVVTAISTVVQLLQYGIPVGRHLDAVFGPSAFYWLESLGIDVPWGLSVLVLVFPVVTFVLGVLPSTRRWCTGAAGQVGGRPVGAWAPGAHMPGMQPYGMRPPVGHHPGVQPVPAAQHLGAAPVPGGHYPGLAPTPGAHPGVVPVPGAQHSAATPALTPGGQNPGAAPIPGASHPGFPQPSHGAPQGQQLPSGQPPQYRPHDGYRP
ncbi:hypothetical protein ACWF9G_20485 [Nocardia sp. NPDC055029]